MPSMMRFRLLLILLLVAISDLHALSTRPADPVPVALRFINEHVAAVPGYEETIARVQASELVTERYKEALAKLYRAALKQDPEYGYGADAVIGGQDSPDRFRVKSSKVNGDRARVVLIGEDPQFPMEVNVDLVREDGRWLVDASGDLIRD
jgi:hypothetical protein